MPREVLGVLQTVKRAFGCVKGVAVAAEPKLHFRPTVLHKGLDPERGVVPEEQTNPNGTVKASHASVPMGLTSVGL